MEGVDIFALWYAKLGIGGILALVVWKVYYDMKADKASLISRITTLEKLLYDYISKDHERVITTLQGTNASRERLAETLDRLCQATERLPCNQSQPVGQRWVTPTYGTPTPPEGNDYEPQ